MPYPRLFAALMLAACCLPVAALAAEPTKQARQISKDPYARSQAWQRHEFTYSAELTVVGNVYLPAKPEAAKGWFVAFPPAGRDRWSLETLASRLSGSGFAVYLPDLPGSGESVMAGKDNAQAPVAKALAGAFAAVRESYPQIPAHLFLCGSGVQALALWETCAAIPETRGAVLIEPTEDAPSKSMRKALSGLAGLPVLVLESAGPRPEPGSPAVSLLSAAPAPLTALLSERDKQATTRHLVFIVPGEQDYWQRMPEFADRLVPWFHELLGN